MSDNNISLVPDVIKSASDAVQANLPETAKQTDGVISTVVEFFNNVVLFPVKKANLTFKHKLEQFEDDLRKKTDSIPDENFQAPPVMIAGPTLEALRYAYDEEELREMYENLLASAMDNRKVTKVHPAYVDAIRQMSPLDVRVLTVIMQYSQLRRAEIQFTFPDKNQKYMYAMPTNFVLELAEVEDPFLVSSSLENLNRLGIIDISDHVLFDSDYSELENHPYVVMRKQMYDCFGKKTEIRSNMGSISLTDYGRAFLKICSKDFEGDDDAD